jgi:radical SAM protein with 4Fe4S-binding SPASM domain
MGRTTQLFSMMVDNVYTIEVNEEYYKQASFLNDYDNIHRYLGDSVEILWEILRYTAKDPILFYLDAHWEDSWPLLGELKTIAKYTTNGYMLYEKYYDLLLKYVDIIKFSIFGVTPKTYQEMHKLQYGRTLNNILNYLDYAKSHTNKPYTSGLFIETDINRHEREDWIKFWEEKLDEVSVWKPHNWLNLRYRIITDNQVSCNRPFSTVYVHANGDVSPCCWDINKKLLVGDLNKNTLTEIMESKALKQIQKKHRRNDFTGLLCGDCDQTCQSEDNLIYSSNKERTVGTYAYEKTVEA